MELDENRVQLWVLVVAMLLDSYTCVHIQDCHLTLNSVAFIELNAKSKTL